MNVGISIFNSPGGNVWNNGLNQNLAFLVHLLRRCAPVQSIFLINGGDGTELPAGMSEETERVLLVKPADVTHRVDVVIEMGAQLPLEWLRHVKALGARLVLFVVGNTYATTAENPVFGRTGGLTFNGTPWDEVWTLSQHMHSCAPMLRTLSRAPVHELPHLWSPAFLQRGIDAAAADGLAFGLQGARRQSKAGWRVGIFEPNISVVKNCTIPMLACEQAYRSDRDAIELMMVMNSVHMKNHPTFNSLAAGLDLTRDSRASYEPRLAFADCMTRHALDAVVIHQWENDRNYLYYDALYGGYPLVHNSDFLRKEGVGLYYPGFSAREAAQVLLHARHQPLEFWQDYAATAQAFLRKLAPEHPDNVSAFTQRLLA